MLKNKTPEPTATTAWKKMSLRNWTALGLLLCSVTAFYFGAVTTAFAARSWTCSGTIALTGSNYSYALPPWSKSGPAIDREKKCRDDIENNWLKNGEIWARLGIPEAQQSAYCQSGGMFRVDYGFDKRKKDWSFTKSSSPKCKCSGLQVFQ